VLLFALFTAIMVFLMTKLMHYRLFDSLLNAIPFGIISSAVAISSTGNLNQEQREFVIYESSFSDIVGILVFDFIILYQDSIGYGLFNYAFKGLITILIAVLITSALAILLHKTIYHINYIIILTSVVLVYALAKMIHLPALLLVLAFGIALANYRIIQSTLIRKYVDFDKFGNDLLSFKRIMTELTFVVRSFFFIMFGYYTSLTGLLNIQNILIALAIIAIIYLLRLLYLRRFLKIPVFPYLFFSPRGLITILLFLSIPAVSRIDIINEQVVTLVILLTIFLMMLGNIFYKSDKVIIDMPTEPVNEPDVSNQTLQ
jgi:Kef-type K+ transport system membrane component KefB